MVHDFSIIYITYVSNEYVITVPSESADITLPSADSDLLIFFASSNTDPSAPVLLTLT